MSITIRKTTSVESGLCNNCMNRNNKNEIEESDIYELIIDRQFTYIIARLCNKCLRELCDAANSILDNSSCEVFIKKIKEKI